MSTDEHLRRIAAEIQGNTLDPVIWTRAFADADGDRDKARARYIRERLAQFEAAAAAETAATPPEAAPAQSRTELGIKREMLAKKLALQGRRSLHDELGVRPASGDEEVRCAIAALRAAEAQGRVLSAEQRYAIQVLGDAASREHYDRRLLDELSRPDDAASPFEAPTRSPLWTRPQIVLGVTALLAVIFWAATEVHRERSRKELAREALRTQEQMELARAERQRQAAAEAEERQEEAARRASALTEQQSRQRQYYVDEQMRLRTAQLEIQQQQSDERRRQAALARQQAEARSEQEKSRREVRETERELCITARRNNNLGEVSRWCRY